MDISVNNTVGSKFMSLILTADKISSGGQTVWPNQNIGRDASPCPMRTNARGTGITQHMIGPPQQNSKLTAVESCQILFQSVSHQGVSRTMLPQQQTQSHNVLEYSFFRQQIVIVLFNFLRQIERRDKEEEDEDHDDMRCWLAGWLSVECCRDVTQTDNRLVTSSSYY